MSGGRQIGTIVGSLVAAYFTAGTSYAALAVAVGGAVGGAAGNLLDPAAPTETNKIDDITVSVSAYGDGIPETWGTDIPKATWIWTTDIIQVGTTSSAGKGGPKNTNYQQFMHGYISLGRSAPPGVTVGIRRAWVDGKLRYDTTSGLSAGQALATADDPFTFLQVYTGAEDQLPHPIIEIYEGVGNVPGFRGTIGIFIGALECPAGRVPQISFELAVNNTIISESIPFSSADLVSGYSPPSWATDGVSFFQYQTIHDATNLSGHIMQVGNLWAISNGGFSTDPGFTYGNGAPTAASGLGPPMALQRVLTGDPAHNPTRYYKLNLVTGDYIQIFSQQVASGASTQVFLAAADENNLTYVVADVNGQLVRWLPSNFDIMPSGNALALGVLANRAYVLVDGQLEVYDENSTLLDTYVSPIGTGASGGICVSPSGLYVYLLKSTTLHFYKIDETAGTWTELGNLFWASFANPFPSTVFACTDSHAIIGNINGAQVDYTMIRFGVVQPTAAIVGDIIESQSLRAGLLEAQFDVSTIDDTVWGYTMPTPTTPRANVAPLLTYGAIGVAEEDGLMRYFHRADKAPVAMISYDDLAAYEGNGDPGDPFPLSRTNADELPRSITIGFNNPEFDYQITTQSARRDTVTSVADQRTDLSIAMVPDAAATIARRMLFEIWLAQMTRSFVIPRKFLYLSAGDVVTFEYPPGTDSDWMISSLTDTGVLIQGECFPADGDLLIQTVPGSGGFKPQQITPLAPPTRLMIVDGPILQDADNNAGLYVPMAGLADGWPGAELFIGTDENTLASQGTVSLSATNGFCENALGDFTLRVVDEKNLLTVNMNQFELTTITRDALLTGTDNVAAVGAAGRWEYIKFQRAVAQTAGPNSSNRYLLSGLLRGERGTEWARSLHQANDQIILLGLAGTLRPILDVGMIGTPRLYRAITQGRSAGTDLTYASTGEGLKPFSPVNVRCARDTSSGITLTCDRRTRLSENWLLGLEPLGETSESYSWDLFTSSAFSTVAGTFTTVTSKLVLTSAQQTAIGLTPGGTVFVNVYQLSSSVGRGHAAKATV